MARQRLEWPEEEGEKRCAKCGDMKSIRECFYVRGDGSTDAICVACRAEYQEKYREDVRTGKRPKPESMKAKPVIVCPKCKQRIPTRSRAKRGFEVKF